MKKNSNIIWEDSKQKPGFLDFFLMAIIVVIFLMGIFFVEFLSVEFFGLLFIAFVFFLTFVSAFRIKYIVIEKEGIWTGNNTHGQMLLKLLWLNQKNTFISWNKIDKIKISEKLVSFSHTGGNAPFILVKTKSGEKYECLIANPKGFINSFNLLRKQNLLTNETKEKYNLLTNETKKRYK